MIASGPAGNYTSLTDTTLKGELVEERDYLTRDEARADVFQYVEGSYNPGRRHSGLGYVTPEQKLAAFQAAASAA